MLTAGVWFPVLPPSCKCAHLIKIFSLPHRSPSGLQAASATFLTNRRICFWSLCGARAEGCRVHRRCAVLLCTPAPGALLEQNYNFDSRMRWCTTGGINRCSKKKNHILASWWFAHHSRSLFPLESPVLLLQLSLLCGRENY